MNDLEKTVLSAVVVVVGSPSLPLTGGTSGIVLLGLLASIWGVNWSGNGDN